MIEFEDDSFWNILRMLVCFDLGGVGVYGLLFVGFVVCGKIVFLFLVIFGIGGLILLFGVFDCVF